MKSGCFVLLRIADGQREIVFWLGLTSTSVPPAHPQVHLCDEFLSAGHLCPTLSFCALLVPPGKLSLALRSQEKLPWSGCKTAKGCRMLLLTSVICVFLLGETCVPVSAASYQADRIYMQFF